MKKLLCTLFVLVASSQFSFAQENDQERYDRIKALKVAFFTQEMNFSDKAAEKFWPIYNKYETERRKLYEKEHMYSKNVECMTEQEATNRLNELLTVESEDYKIKKQLFKDLGTFMTAKEIIKVQDLEDEFHKKLITEYRSKKDRNKT